MKKQYLSRQTDSNGLVIGNRIPREYFVTKGKGESDITVHAGSYHLALKEAGIESYNIMTYSSIMPAIAMEIQQPKGLVHGSVMETISAVCNACQGETATAGIIYGWLYDKKTGKKYGGLVCECNGQIPLNQAKKQLRFSLDELYYNGYSKRFKLKNIKLITNSFIPKKKYGTALVAICFVNYLFPVIKD